MGAKHFFLFNNSRIQGKMSSVVVGFADFRYKAVVLLLLIYLQLLLGVLVLCFVFVL